MAQVTTGDTAGTSDGGTTATTGAVTVASGEMLVVCVVIEDPDFTVDSVVWDVPSPQNFSTGDIAIYQPPHGRQSVHTWYLLNPTPGTDTITITTSDVENFGALAVVVTNGDATTLLSGRVAVEGDPANTLTVNPNQGANDLALALYATREKEALTTDAGTEIIEIEAANSFNMSLSTIDGSGAIDITVSNTVASECEMVGFVLNEAGASDQDISVGQATETDTAQPITLVGETIAVGQVTETDTAQAVTADPGVVGIAVGQAVEINTAGQITTFGNLVKSDRIAGSSLTMTSDLGSNPLAGNLLILVIGSRLSTDVLDTAPGDGFTELDRTITGDMNYFWYWKISDGTEQTAAVTWSDGGGHASLYAEYNWENNGTPTISKNENEDNITGTVSSQVTGAVTPDAAQNIVIAFHGSDNSETNFDSQAVDGSWIEDFQFIDSLICGIKTSRLVNASGSQEATHTDSDDGDAMYGAIAAFSVVTGDQGIAVGQATETDVAQAITVVPGLTTIVVGQASETDAAQAVTVQGAISISVGQAVETDVAQTVTPVPGEVTIAVGQATETDVAQAVTVQGAIAIAVGQAVETDLAQTITVQAAISIAVGQAAETDLAQTITVQGAISIAVGQAVETDLAQTITVVQADSQTQDQFRWYNDNGVEDAATPILGQNVNITRVRTLAAILRFQVNNTGDFPAQQMVLQVKKTSDPDSTYRDVPVAD